MAFPETPLPVSAEVFVNGAWLSISSRVRGAPDIMINRGQSNEQGEASPVTCDLTFNNRDGYLSNRNPGSALYGQLGKNTQLRIGAASGGVVLQCPRYELAANRVTTADAAPLDIVGDTEWRVDIEPYSWRPAVPIMLASKWDGAGQASWALHLNSAGAVVLTWTTSGFTATSVSATSTASVATAGRKAIKITLDVNNGAAGWTVAFATSDTINGTYVALGSSVIGAPVTSVFSGTATLVVGSGFGGTPTFTGYESFGGRYYGFSLRNGIGGSEVAKADFTTQAEGATSFTDGLGNTWSKAGLARISAYQWRFHGELSSLPQEWDPTGRDVWVPAQASGVKRRLTQGTQPVTSASYRALAIKTLTGWWPCEDGALSTTIGSAIPGSPAATVFDTTVGVDDTLPTSAGAITFTSASSTMHGDCKDTGTNTGNAQFFFYFKFPTVPAFEVQLFTVFSTGTASFPFFCIYTTATTYKVNFFDSGGNVIATNSTAFGANGAPNQWVAMWLDMTQSGGNVQWNLSWYSVDNQTFYSFGGGLSFVGTVGRIKAFQVWDRTGRDGMQLAHIVATQSNYNFYSADFALAAKANKGELVAERIDRISEEEGVIFNLRGSRFDTEFMGPQLPGTSWGLMQEAADLDGGILAESRDYVGVFYRTRVDMHNQQAVILDYTSKHLWQELRPIDDDQNTRNIVTVSRPDGSFAIAKQTTGPLSISAPTDTPAGVGPYKSEVSRNTLTDTRLLALAQYEVQLGTVDELRYAAVNVNCARSVIVAGSLFNAVPSADLGDMLALTTLPVWLPPGTTELMTYGITERITNRSTSRSWEFSFRCAPYSPYRVNTLTSYDTSRQKAGTLNTTLGAAINSSALSLVAYTAAGKRPWSTTASKPANFPLDIMMGGEQITVSGISAFIADAFGRTSASSFGSADVGGAYTLVNGAAADFNVSGGLGRITNASTGVYRMALLAAQNVSDFDIKTTVSCSAVALTQSILPFIVARYVNTSNYYRFEVTFTIAGNVDLRIRKVVAGVETSIAYTPNILTYTAGSTVNLRTQVFGSTLRARIWSTAATAVETGVWDVTATDTSLPAAGPFGVGSFTNIGNTNVNPESRFDDIVTTSPQIFTLSARSVNTVSKAQAFGTSIDVFKSFKATR